MHFLQETEGELFKRKSQWSESFAAFMEYYGRVVSFFTLWKTSIQRVEGKHCRLVMLTACHEQFSAA